MIKICSVISRVSMFDFADKLKNLCCEHRIYIDSWYKSLELCFYIMRLKSRILGYQHFFRTLWHFNTWIGIINWSQISNISVKYWSPLPTSQLNLLNKCALMYVVISAGSWVLVDQYFTELFEICDPSTIPIHVLKCRKILKKCW